MITFDFIWLLPLAVLLPVAIVWLLVRAGRQRAARLARFGEADVVQRLLPPAASHRKRWRPVRLAAAGALIGIAIAGPRWGTEQTIVRTSGIDMVFALDASLSMMATDERPSRLERMKEEVRRLREMSRGDRVGLIAFAGRSYVLSPMTIDAGALDLFMDNLDPSVVGQAGSSLSQAIRQGTDLLTLTKTGADRALIVMSDGESFEPVENVVAEAQRAKAQGISVVTVGFGTTTGSTIPIRDNGTTTEKRDASGQIVITKYSPQYLQAAAQAAQGTFIAADQSDKATRVRAALANLRAQQRIAAAGETKTPRYQWFLLPAVLLLMLDTLLAERRGRRKRLVAAAEPAAVTAALLLMVFGTGCSDMRTRSDAIAAYHEKRFAQSAALFKSLIDAGARDEPTLYNFGTALVGADSLAPAAEVLERVAESKDPDMKYRALFNEGLAQLVRGLRAPADQADEPLDAALAVYKKILLLHPDDQDAKWNYELALRKKHGGGGGGGGGGPSSPQPSPQSQAPKPAGGLGQSQAEQLLGSAAREERDVQAKRQKQSPTEPPPGGKDW